MAITGARGRLAPWIAQALEASGACLDLYSRTAGEAILPLSAFPAGEPPDVLIHCAWSTVPFTAEKQPGLCEQEDLPRL
ncbi:MAG: hypothetical protein N2322_05740 [Terrimicrobiaceae bacterium]|nr:hypothetical protein [Terrimicrobiaceae bacterium]